MNLITFTELFSFTGKIGRLKLLQADFYLLVGCVVYFLLACWMVLIADRTVHTSGGMVAVTLLSTCILLLVVLMLWSLCAVHVQRLHDFGLSGYWYIAIVGWMLLFLSVRTVDAYVQHAGWYWLYTCLGWLPELLLLLLPGVPGDIQ